MTDDERGHFEQGRWVPIHFDGGDYVRTTAQAGDTAHFADLGITFRFFRTGMAVVEIPDGWRTVPAGGGNVQILDADGRMRVLFNRYGKTYAVV
jgi:hypothetical protein